jgi:hypothetical protein
MSGEALRLRREEFKKKFSDPFTECSGGTRCQSNHNSSLSKNNPILGPVFLNGTLAVVGGTACTQLIANLGILFFFFFFFLSLVTDSHSPAHQLRA